MSRRKAPVPQEDRPNVNPDAIPHRDLLEPGPAAIELKIRPCRFEERVCGSSKRNADSAALDSSSRSVHPDQTSTKPANARPAKALKVIEHRFANGQSVEDHSRGIRTSYTNEMPKTFDDDSQSGKENVGLPASPDYLMYKETFSGKWRTTKRLPRMPNPGPAAEGHSGNRVPRPRMKQDYRLDTDTEETEYTSDDETSALAENKEDPTPNGAAASNDLCAGTAGEHIRYPLRDGQDSLNSGLLSRDNELNSVVNKSGGSFSLPFDSMTHLDTLNTNQHGMTNNYTATDVIPNPLFGLPLMSMREMASSVYPSVHHLVQASQPIYNPLTKAKKRNSSFDPGKSMLHGAR
jgi:hypothetical protein